MMIALSVSYRTAGGRHGSILLPVADTVPTDGRIHEYVTRTLGTSKWSAVGRPQLIQVYDRYDKRTLPC